MLFSICCKEVFQSETLIVFTCDKTAIKTRVDLIIRSALQTHYSGYHNSIMVNI